MENNQTDSIGTWDGEKVASLVLAFAAAPLVLYVTISMMIYSIRKELKSDQVYRRKYNILMKVLSILGGFSVLSFNVVQMPFVVRLPMGYCPVYECLRVIFFGLGILSTYGVFWVRMLTTFYLDPVLKENIGRWLHIFSRVTFVVLLIGAAASTGLFLSPLRYRWNPTGCAVDETIDVGTKWGIVALTTFVCQASLLFYFIYPIYMHRRRMLTEGIEQNNAMPLVKQLAITMAVCVAVNVICYSVVIVYKSPMVFLSHLALNVNLLVHLCALLYSFTDWKRVMTPTCFFETDLQSVQ
ncbi:uncharacterized protein LOC100182603 [Ciona intestinalis]